ncbi:class I SAM-dependent methyltransferase [Streptomyces sp. NPDC057743]|uniref:class I SAM-dependent methyltransferase n=1 Tax=Streptomyces sp. NPDC057743 TaxID=3346236 RepID=UPI0036C355F7
MNSLTPRHDPVPRQRPAERWAFLREAARDMRTTGAVAPSGPALAEALTDPVRARAPRPLTVLEAGAGTGAVTRALLAQLPPGSRLDVLDANPRFTTRLRHLVAAHAPGVPPAGPAGIGVDVGVHHARVERWATDRRYDVIVSGLPLANFTPQEVRAIMDRYLELLRPDGVLTYFAYRGARPVRALLAAPAAARRQRAVDAVLAAYRDRCAASGRTVWANLPPARVWRLHGPRPGHLAPVAVAVGAGRWPSCPTPSASRPPPSRTPCWPRRCWPNRCCWWARSCRPSACC